VLEIEAQRIEALYGDQPPRPPHWGGYRLVPDEWQFWQGRRSRLHDRLRYQLGAQGQWVRERLAP
jgi:pyridoxamine 5'-phosphate oxidase